MSNQSWLTAIAMVDEFSSFVLGMEILPGVTFVNALIFCLVLGWVLNALGNKEP